MRHEEANVACTYICEQTTGHPQHDQWTAAGVRVCVCVCSSCTCHPGARTSFVQHITAHERVNLDHQVRRRGHLLVLAPAPPALAPCLLPFSDISPLLLHLLRLHLPELPYFPRKRKRGEVMARPTQAAGVIHAFIAIATVRCANLEHTDYVVCDTLRPRPACSARCGLCPTYTEANQAPVVSRAHGYLSPGRSRQWPGAAGTRSRKSVGGRLDRVRSPPLCSVPLPCAAGVGDHSHRLSAARAVDVSRSSRPNPWPHAPPPHRPPQTCLASPAWPGRGGALSLCSVCPSGCCCSGWGYWYSWSYWSSGVCFASDATAS